MYPKNAASPQRVAIGPVVQISDGAVQTSGVSVKVMPQGGTASAGGGTIAYEEGIVHYVPTQAETNYASFILIAYKTGCIPASVTIVTTVSSTAGHAGLDWANVIGPTTTVNLSGTTIKTATDVETGTADIQTRLPAALVSGRIDASVGAMAANVITAAATAADYVTEVQSGLATQSSVNTIDDFLDTEIAALTTELAKVPKSDGTATWNATALASLQQEATDALNAYAPATAAALAIVDDFLDTEIAALTTELAKVPKSDGAATWNATALASLQQEATDALNAYDPPTNAEMVARTLLAADYATATLLNTVAGYLDTEIAAILADTNELQTDWANGGRLDLILDARASQTSVDDIPTVTEFNARTLASADYATATALATVDTVVDSIKQVTDTAIRGSAVTGTLSTTQMTTDLTEATDDHYIGRLITWTSGVLAGQQTNVTDYAGATKMLTYATTTDAPGNGDTFILT